MFGIRASFSDFDWARDEHDGSLSCPVIVTTQSREDALVNGLLARGRSDPGARVLRAG